jgi:hypothetical protein
LGSERDEVTGEWSKTIHTEGLTDLYNHKILFGDQIEKNEMGEERNTYGGEKRCIQGFGGET